MASWRLSSSLLVVIIYYNYIIIVIIKIITGGERTEQLKMFLRSLFDQSITFRGVWFEKEIFTRSIIC
jgi:hypothetical protein